MVKNRHTHHGDDVRNAVSAVDYSSSQCPFTYLSGRPRGSQRQDSLNQKTVTLLKLNQKTRPFNIVLFENHTWTAM